MMDSTAINEMVKQIMDAYRVFSIELKSLQIKKTDLVKSILARVEQEKTTDIENTIKQMIYDRKNSQN
jgi:hypothetical protein